MNEKPASSTATIEDAAWLNAPSTQELFAALNRGGHTARAVGGCVRNSLLAQMATGDGCGLVPAVTDIDVATTATPNETISLAEEAGLRTVPTGLQHGTVTVIAADGTFEVTTLRRDIATDGRRAEVAFTDDWLLDAARRDLTINALYADSDGTVYDPIGGFADLEAKRIRFVGDPVKRIQEDYLRILRFFRFYAQYGHGAPDPAGLAACSAERNGLNRLSGERVHQELLKLVCAPGAIETLQIMIEYGVLTVAFPVAPNVCRLSRLRSLEKHPDPALRLAALTVHSGEDTERLWKHLRLSNQEKRVLALAGEILDGQVRSRPDIAEARRLVYRLAPDDYRRWIKFVWSLGDNRSVADDLSDLLDLPDLWRRPQLPINGQDLIDLGFKPGPELGDLLRYLEDHWLREDFSTTRSDLLALAQMKVAK